MAPNAGLSHARTHPPPMLGLLRQPCHRRVSSPSSRGSPRRPEAKVGWTGVDAAESGTEQASRRGDKGDELAFCRSEGRSEGDVCTTINCIDDPASSFNGPVTVNFMGQLRVRTVRIVSCAASSLCSGTAVMGAWVHRSDSASSAEKDQGPLFCPLSASSPGPGEKDPFGMDGGDAS